MEEFSRIDNATSGMAPWGAAAVSVLREAEAWTSAQCALVSGIGVIWTDWFKRRREAIEASARSLQQMLECRNPADFAQIQQQWFAEAARRDASDVGALACDGMALIWWAAAVDRHGGRDPSPPVSGTGRAKPRDAAPLPRAAAE
jgi:hypothetical protein